MTLDELRYKSIMGMRSKGVTAIKIECEAQLNRPDYNDSCNECDQGRHYCDYCDTDGETQCGNCVGTGLDVSTVDGDTTSSDCESCDGTGYVSCDDCGGEHEWECGYCDGNYMGGSGDFGSESYCLNYILDRVADLTHTERKNGDSSDETIVEPFEWMSYARFYNDGSVDSENTLTIPLTDDLDINHIPKVLEAFKDLGEAVGEGIDIDGAGMHIALLFDKDCRYPCRSGISGTKLSNFRRSMTQLLPAMYFLGTSNDTSRGMTYRRPTIGIDTHRAAIDYRNGALEYRLFDTCYDKPEAILDNLVVIANTLKYLTDTYKDPNLHKITEELNFGNDNSYQLDRFYSSATHIDVLNAGLALLKPSYYTMRQLKEQRGFKVTKRTFNGLERKYLADAEAAWQEYVDRFEWSTLYKAEQFKANALQDFSQYGDIAAIRSTTPDAKLAEIDTTVQEKIKDWKASMEQKEDFVKDKINRAKRCLRGEYTLSFVNSESMGDC